MPHKFSPNPKRSKKYRSLRYGNPKTCKRFNQLKLSGIFSDSCFSQSNLWITSPERSFGSNQVVFGGMMLPVSAISINCFIDTG